MRNVILATFFLAGLVYADSRGTQIVGRWTEANGRDRIELKADGTYTGIVVCGPDHAIRAITGTYFIDGDNVGFTISNMGPTSMLWKVTITPAGFAVIYEDGGPVKEDHTSASFQRVK